MSHRFLIFVLALSLLTCSSATAQLRDPATPDWVYISSVGSVLVMGGIWYFNTYKKISKGNATGSLKQRAEQEIVYLATDAERKAFKKIKTDDTLREFMAAFWLRRDPDPHTPENEVKEAYLLRLAHVNASFREQGREGWQTERGRVYLLFGPPDEILHEPWANFLFYEPTIKAFELWSYHRPTTGGEPPNLFAGITPGMVKFVFGDLEGAGNMTQIYSSEIGEKQDVRALLSSAPRSNKRY